MTVGEVEKMSQNPPQWNDSEPIGNPYFVAGYGKGISDVLYSFLEVMGVQINPEIVTKCVDDIINGIKDIRAVLSEIGLDMAREYLVSSRDMTQYPQAMDRISDFIFDHATNPEAFDDETDLLYGFFVALNEISEAFRKEIKGHIDSRGAKLGIVITLVYMAGRVFYVAGIIRGQMSILGCSRFFDKTDSTPKKFIKRLRESRPRAMRCIEGDPKPKFTLQQILDALKDL